MFIGKVAIFHASSIIHLTRLDYFDVLYDTLKTSLKHTVVTWLETNVDLPLLYHARQLLDKNIFNHKLSDATISVKTTVAAF